MRTELVSAVLAMPLFWLCLCNNFFVVSGFCPDDQRSLLIQLKNNLTFEPESSSKLKLWNQSIDCCNWSGVTCDDEGRVIGLDLSGESIMGGFGHSSSLFSLQHLHKLNLAYNDFNTVIPSAFKRLKNLTYLNLSWAGFVGQIPIEISQLTRLVTLDLSYLYSVNGSKLKIEKPNLRKLVQNLTSIRQLYLDGVRIPAAGHEWCSALMSLHDLQEVRMSQCNLSGPLDPSLARLQNLSVIVLDGNNLSSPVPETFAHLKSLTILSLFDCQLTGTFPYKIFNIGTLSVVDVSFNNNLQGFFQDFPPGSLQILRVGNTSFSGAFPNSIGNMKNLSELDFSYCRFNGTLPNSLSNLTELSYLDLSCNNFTGQMPSFDMAKNLMYLNLSNNGLGGAIPSSSHFEGLNQLSSIDLSYNSITGSIPSSLFTRPGLQRIMLSHNQFGQLEEFTNVSSSYLYELDLSSNNLSGSFPTFLRNLSTSLDLSDNHIQGTVPNWIWNLEWLNISHNLLTHLEGPLQNIPSKLYLLDLHHNKLQGPIPVFPEKAIYLDFSSNKFNSVIPRDIGNYLSYTLFLSLSNNTLSGSIPESLCNSYLEVLDLSNNNISGTIPSCLMATNDRLGVLNLGKNSLMGPVPDKFSATCALGTLDLHQNKLDGKIPRSLSNCASLEVLNLGENKIMDVFPCVLKKISTLRVLVLRENNLYGHIGCPNTKATWRVLQILDLAINNFTGKLPETFFTRWKAMVSEEKQDKSKVKSILYQYFESAMPIYYEDSVTASSKGQEIELVKILTIFTSIDFSSNHFEGEIPKELFDFKALYILNLSNNAFSGKIPQSIGNLKVLESLDLSNNSLEGNIPTELGSLSFLSWLDLSSNHLVGMIPTGTQLQSFPAASFEGNDGLYGPPLTEKVPGIEPGVLPKRQESVSSIDWNFISVELGLIFGHGIIFVHSCFGSNGGYGIGNLFTKFSVGSSLNCILNMQPREVKPMQL